jgi:VWFA-related protein
VSVKFPALLVLCASTLALSQAIQIPAAAPLVPPAAPGSPQPSATIHQTVNNVVVDVVVTDKSGQPIKNLSKDHFQITENGASQQIAYFEEHQAEPAPPAPAHMPSLPPNIYTNIATTVPDNGPTLVLLMDALNTPILDQAKVRAAMIEFLHGIPQGRHIAIFTLTSRLHMVQGFNSDPSTLIATLNQPANWQKQSTLTDNAGEDSYSDFMAGNISRDSSYIAHEQAWRIDQKVGYTLAALNSLAAYLSALPGRKNLIWFSGSFPLGLGPDSPMPQGFDPSKFVSESLDRSRNYDSELHQTSEALKMARVAVYPMLAGGPSTPSQFSSSQTTNSLTGGSSLANPATMINNANIESSNNLASNATMDTLAEATGGRAFHNTNDLVGAIATVTQLGSNYYTVAYAPKDKNYDGKYRKLAIKVDAPKARLDYRRGYYAEDPAKAAISSMGQPTRTTSALLHGAPAATDILFKVRVAPTDAANQPAQRGVVRYSVNWSVDVRGLNLTESAGGMRRGSLTLAVVAYNSDAKAINNVSTPVSLILESDEFRIYLKSGLQFHQELDLPTGQVYLRMAIVDTDKDRAGATEIPLTVSTLPAQTSAAQPIAQH